MRSAAHCKHHRKTHTYSPQIYILVMYACIAHTIYMNTECTHNHFPSTHIVRTTRIKHYTHTCVYNTVRCNMHAAARMPCVYRNTATHKHTHMPNHLHRLNNIGVVVLQIKIGSNAKHIWVLCTCIRNPSMFVLECVVQQTYIYIVLCPILCTEMAMSSGCRLYPQIH